LIFWAFVNFLALQPLTSEYLQDAVALDQRCLGGLWTESGYQREIDSLNSDLLMLSVEPASTLIGLACAWAILDEAHITLLAVDPDYQRQGLGQLMLWALLRLAQQRQMQWATLEVRASNQAAISLYQKFGFESVGRRPRYYPDNNEDALILWCKGLQRPEFTETLARWRQNLEQRLTAAAWQIASLPEAPQIDGELANAYKSTTPS
jgi:ribosomal-protein-alanine N-acetyltransferase